MGTGELPKQLSIAATQQPLALSVISRAVPAIRAANSYLAELGGWGVDAGYVTSLEDQELA
eukprot:662640-Amphidinium_carterae.1